MFARTRFVSLFLGLVLVIGLAPAAQADSTQLCRAVSSILLAPSDLILGPYIAGKDLHYGLTEQGDPMILKVIGTPPGYAYLVMMQLGGSIFRVIAGVFELPMGMFTLFREGAEGPLFKSQDETYALYSEDFGPCPVRIGSSYNTINEF